MRKLLVISLILPLLPLSGCAIVRDKIPLLGKKEIRVGGVYKENFDPERVVDLIIVKRLTGEKRFGIFTRYAPFLEGYIRGVVVDYDDTPIQGVVARVMDGNRDYPGFDPGVSDADGIYKIRFSLPIKKNMVDIQGSIAYNPPWQQQLEMLGASLEPQTKQTKFRFYFNRKEGLVGMGEDAPKTIVRKSTGENRQTGARGASGNPGSSYQPPPAPRSTPKPAAKKEEDFFGDFGN